MTHPNASPLSGQTVTITLPRRAALALDLRPESTDEEAQYEYRVEDYWDRLSGMSWRDSNGNFSAMHYGLRAGMAGLPWDDEVLYGKINNRGVLIHVSEIQSEA